ncbi:armadillo-type protein [Melanogaster broomeanus]|nr:armadillo-type protein [Melanogaster broomeanus]
MISPEVQDDDIWNAEGEPIAGGQLFRKYLLNRCQDDFERGWTIKAANEKMGEKWEESERCSDEYYATQKTKRHRPSLVKFMGELFKVQMLTERVMHQCVKKLLNIAENPEEEVIESLCQLLKTPQCQSRMQSMLQDVIELRDRGWMVRGGVRNAGSGSHGWTTAGSSIPRPPPKAGDLSQFGRVTKLAPMIMGPSNVVNSLSGTNSSLNMFSMLSQNPELTANTAAKASRPPGQRRKLQLLPRTWPSCCRRDSSPCSEEEPETPVQMSEADVKKKIDEDVASALESKEADAILVGEFFAQAASKGQCSAEMFEAGFLPLAEFLDDIAIDAPNAFKFMAVMLKGAGFDKDEERLGRIAGKSMDSDKLLQLVWS